MVGRSHTYTGSHNRGAPAHDVASVGVVYLWVGDCLALSVAPMDDPISCYRNTSSPRGVPVCCGLACDRKAPQAQWYRSGT